MERREQRRPNTVRYRLPLHTDRHGRLVSSCVRKTRVQVRRQVQNRETLRVKVSIEDVAQAA
jgi:hypothetical protein